MTDNLSTWSASPTFTATGKFGTALTSGVLKSPAGAGWRPPTPSTVEGWLKAASAGAIKVAISLGNNWIGYDATGKCAVGINGTVQSSTVSIIDNVWHHVALTCDGTNAKLWIDGALAFTYAYTSTQSVGGTGDGLGGLIAAAGYDWPGAIDEVRTSNIVRYTSAFTPPTAAFTVDANTVSLYHLDSGGTDSVSSTIPQAFTGKPAQLLLAAPRGNYTAATKTAQAFTGRPAGLLLNAPAGTFTAATAFTPKSFDGKPAQIILTAPAGSYVAGNGLTPQAFTGRPTQLHLTAPAGTYSAPTAPGPAAITGHPVGLIVTAPAGGYFVSDEADGYAESWGDADGPILFDTAELNAYAYSWAYAIASFGATITPGQTRPTCRLKVVTKTGDVLFELTGAKIDTATQTLNGRGGIRFTLPKADADVLALRQFSEVQLWRGPNLVPGAWFVIVDPDIPAGAKTVAYECPGLTYYFERALIGDERPEMLRNGGFEEGARYWNFRYDPGSNAETPPQWEITSDACEGGKALRIFAEDKVVDIRNIVETEAVFVGNEATFLPGGEQAILDAVNGIPDGTHLTIEGHTADADGGTGYDLSVARAEAARDVIAAHNSTYTYTIIGKGETEPIDPRHIEAAYKRNRRVEILATVNQTKIGHRQYADQSFDVTVGAGVRESLEYDVQMQARIDEFQGPSKDGWMAYADVRPLTDLTKVLNEAHVDIDETSPRKTWMGLNLTVKTPLTAGTYRVTVRGYPTAGSTSFDQVSAKPNLKLAFWDTDPRNIIAGLVTHAQSPTYGKGDLNITTTGPLSGFTISRSWEWKEGKPVSEAIDDIVRGLNGPDANIVVTARKRVLAVAPKAGRLTGLTLAAGNLAGDARIVSYAAGLNGDDVVTTARVQSSWSGGGLSEEFVRAPRPDGLVLESLFRADQDTPTSTLREQGRAAVKYGKADAVTRVVMHPDDTTELMEQVTIGDVVTVAISDSRVNVYAPHRVIRIDYDPDNDQLAYDIAEEA